MFNNPILTIIIPCYNEEQNLLLLEKEINQIINFSPLINFIIVDNGSLDNTRQICQMISKQNPTRIQLITIDNNIGYGYGIIKGIELSQTKFTGWTHADLQAPLISLIDVLNILQNENVESIKAIRLNRDLKSKLLSLGMQFFASLIFHEYFLEINAHPTIAKTDQLKNIHFKFMNSSFDLEVYYNLKKHGNIRRFKIQERARIHGESHWKKSFLSKTFFIKNTIKDIISMRNQYKK